MGFPTATPLMRRLATMIAWLACLYAIRFGIMEIEPAADPCLAAPGGWLCQGRAALGFAIHFQTFGITALALAVPAFIGRGRWRKQLASAALYVAVAALVLYNLRYGAPAAVLALLALADAGTFRPSKRALP